MALVWLVAHGGEALVPPSSVARPATRLRAHWEGMYSDLRTYKSTWGTADAPLGDELGRWCATQRRLKESGRLDAAKAEKLEALGFSWSNPSALSDEELEERWRVNVEKLVAYKHRHGDAQVPKKWREDPKLGGWVAAVRRRGRDVLSPERQADLDGIFEWVSNRSCGSSFMVNFRKLREWQASYDPGEMPDDLQAWSSAVRAAASKGKLSQERLDYLGSIGFFQ